MAEHKRMETDNVLDKKAQRLMEDRDAESRTRVFEGTLNKVFTVVLVIWAIFQVWANTFGTLGAVKLRTAHIMFLLPLARRAASKTTSRQMMPTSTSVSFSRPVLASAS